MNNIEKRYFITREQLEDIEYYKRMFDVHSNSIRDLCSSEKDDVVYGFELGEIHSHLRQCFMNMMELENAIRSQKIEEEIDSKVHTREETFKDLKKEYNSLKFENLKNTKTVIKCNNKEEWDKVCAICYKPWTDKKESSWNTGFYLEDYPLHIYGSIQGIENKNITIIEASEFIIENEK